MKKLLWTAYAVLLSGHHLFAQVGQLPLGSPKALAANAERNANRIRVFVGFREGGSWKPVVETPLLPYAPTDGPLGAILERHLTNALAVVSDTGTALSGKMLWVFYTAEHAWPAGHGATNAVTVLFSLDGYTLSEEGGRLAIPSAAYEVDTVRAAGLPQYVPIFTQGVEWVTVDLSPDSVRPALHLDSRDSASALDLRVSGKTGGLIEYSSHLARSGRSGEMTVYAGGTKWVHNHADGRLIGEKEPLRLELIRVRDLLAARARGALGDRSVTAEYSYDLKTWRPFPTVLASFDSGYANVVVLPYPSTVPHVFVRAYYMPEPVWTDGISTPSTP